MIKVGVLGATGRVGQSLLRLLEAHPRCKLIAASASHNNPLIGQDIGIIFGEGPKGIILSADAKEVFAIADIVLDFTNAVTVHPPIDLATTARKPFLIGTTGLDESHYEHLRLAAQTIPILQATNTSLGISILQSLVQKVAHLLDSSFDIEIVETHHRHKVDAPSGTSLSLGKAAAKGRKVDFAQVACFERHGVTGPRPEGQIGFAVQRGGAVIGEHAVRFIGDEEILELSHTGLSRNLYAKGAIRAAEWLIHQPPGLYSMQEALA